VTETDREQEYEGVLAKRVSLLRLLRKDGVSGLLSVAVTRANGHVALLVLVQPGYSGKIPRSYQGTAVMVRETTSASVQFSC
jgi:hypothetical protein